MNESIKFLSNNSNEYVLVCVIKEQKNIERLNNKNIK